MVPSDNHLTSIGLPSDAAAKRHNVGVAASTPHVTQLAAELQTVSYYGIGHATDGLSEKSIPDLAGVARCLAPDAKGRLRVSIALAVREAVLLIDPPRRREAVAELLWLNLDDPDFEEDRSRKRKPLRERHPAVAALLGQALSSYERRKRWQQLYEEVAVNLLTLLGKMDEMALESPLTSASKSTESEIDTGQIKILTVAEAAADLYFAALTSLFVGSFHNELADNVNLQVSRLYDWANSANWLFVCYCHFFIRHFGLPYTPRRGGIRDRLHPLIRLSERNDPLPGRREHISVLAFGTELERGSTDISRSAWFDAALSHVREGLDEMEAAGEEPDFREWHKRTLKSISGNMFEEAWMPWYQEQFNIRTWPPSSDRMLPTNDLMPEGIVMLAAVAERYLEILTQSIDLGRPVFTYARQRAHSIISSFYDIDDQRPLGIGGSLKDYIDYFFDEAAQPTACENRQKMLQM